MRSKYDRGPTMTDRDLHAGDFPSWLAGMRAALRGERPSDVPCRECTACCTSSQFVHIEPDETDTLAHIPPELLFPAPRMPRGHVLLGYDERGHCPMLVDDRCSIYEHRPRTCRTYDCRIFAATGVPVDGDKPAIAQQAARWQFAFPGEVDLVSRRAVGAAAAFLGDHGGHPAVPASTTALAVLAVEIHDLFLGHDDETGELVLVDPDPDSVLRALRRPG